jgi:hypothetical protein
MSPCYPTTGPRRHEVIPEVKFSEPPRPVNLVVRARLDRKWIINNHVELLCEAS